MLSALSRACNQQPTGQPFGQSVVYAWLTRGNNTCRNVHPRMYCLQVTDATEVDSPSDTPDLAHALLTQDFREQPPEGGASAALPSDDIGSDYADSTLVSLNRELCCIDSMLVP